MRAIFRRPVALTLAFGLALAAGWFFTPGPNRCRRCAPVAGGRTEAVMWRASDERRRLRLMAGLMLNANRDFGLSPFDSMRAGYAAAEAARTFQKSHSRHEAQAALPALRRYFRTLASATHSSFDADEAARLELEWWQRRREVRGPHAYAPAVAAAAAYIYGAEPASLARYAELRSAAMHLRDIKRRHITDADWRRIEATLIESYRALRAEVSGQPPLRRASAA
jgi:hypothetical protein